MVFEDLVRATDIKIHDAACGHAKRTEETDTTRWHGPYNYDEAKRMAEILANHHKLEWKDADCCLG